MPIEIKGDTKIITKEVIKEVPIEKIIEVPVEKIIEKTNGNLKLALWNIQLIKLGYDTTTDYDTSIKNI